MTTAQEEHWLSGKLLDMPRNSERMLNGHTVARFADGWRVDGDGIFSHRNALARVIGPPSANQFRAFDKYSEKR